jgi:hypothetical protein
MTASRSDMYLLSQDPTFQNRVQASMLAAAIAIANEGYAVIFHAARASFAVGVLISPRGVSGGLNYTILFTNTVATDANVIADATVGGTVALTTNNAVTQAALVTDAHIDAAVSAQWNAFFNH